MGCAPATGLAGCGCCCTVVPIAACADVGLAADCCSLPARFACACAAAACAGCAGCVGCLALGAEGALARGALRLPVAAGTARMTGFGFLARLSLATMRCGMWRAVDATVG
jgi:hypothetical protein